MEAVFGLINALLVAVFFCAVALALPVIGILATEATSARRWHK